MLSVYYLYSTSTFASVNRREVFKERSFVAVISSLLHAGHRGGYQCVNNYIQKAASPSPEPFDTLNMRERKVMQIVIQGMSSAEIGKKLFISPRTVDIHRANLMHKLGLRTRIDLSR